VGSGIRTLPLDARSFAPAGLITTGSNVNVAQSGVKGGGKWVNKRQIALHVDARFG